MKTMPWWEALKLRDEITVAGGSIDDVQMSLFNAVYGFGGKKPPYAKATYYGDITFPSQNLVDLLSKVAVRLAAPGAAYLRADALYRLSQSMGGGKSHGLIGLYHLGAHSKEFACTDVGKKALDQAQLIAGVPLPADLNQPRVVVMACDNMTAGVTKWMDGPGVSLYERFLWRLFDGDDEKYQDFQQHYGDKDKLAEAMNAVGRPVLILMDEILDYLRQLSDSKNADLAVQDMAFLKALTDTVNDVPNVAMVVVMIASDKDTTQMDVEGERRRAELSSLLDRNGKPATVTSNTDFAAILRRRLFDAPPTEGLLEDTADLFLSHVTGGWAKQGLPGSPEEILRFREEATRCYPFHPSLIHLAETEWANVSGFQIVRSTIRVFAATVYALSERGNKGGWSPLLIGPGDVPLSQTAVRESVIGSGLIVDEKTQANYRQVASTDVVGHKDDSGNARMLDLNRKGAAYEEANPRAAERMATALFLYSIIGARHQGRQGATEAELKAAAFVPDATFTVGDADGVLAELCDLENGLAALERLPGTGGQAARLFLSTRQTLNMMYRAFHSSVTEDERDDELAEVVEGLLATGPFKEKKFVRVSKEDAKKTCLQIISTADIDEARKTRLIALDPRKFSLLNGADEETRIALRAAFGIGPDKLPVSWASSMVFAVVNTQRRTNARHLVKNFIAWNRVCRVDEVKAERELFEKAQSERKDAETSMKSAVRKAFQHLVYLSEQQGKREMQVIRLENDNETSLFGHIAWQKLVERDKAFGTDEFRGKSLIANLLDSDYRRPLDELRDLFWNSPRMPLLPGGESDLQAAIFDGVQAGLFRLVDKDDSDRVMSSAQQINLSATGLKIVKPTPVEPTLPEPTDECDDAPTVTVKRPSVVKEGKEVQIAFTLQANLSDKDKRNALWKVVNQLATAVDGDASFIQMTVRVVTPEGNADDLDEPLQQLGCNPVKTKMP